MIVVLFCVEKPKRSPASPCISILVPKTYAFVHLLVLPSEESLWYPLVLIILLDLSKFRYYVHHLTLIP